MRRRDLYLTTLNTHNRQTSMPPVGFEPTIPAGERPKTYALDRAGRVINASQRPLPDNTQHSQQTNFHAPGGIRTHNPSRRAAEDLRLRPRGYWDRQLQSYSSKILKSLHLHSLTPLSYPTASVSHTIPLSAANRYSV